MKCSRCGSVMQPNYRFCTECGNPLTAPAGAPPAPGGMRPAPGPMPGVAPYVPPVSPPAQVAAAAMTTVAPGMSPTRGESIRLSSTGALTSSSQPVTVFATDEYLVILPPGGIPRVEKIRHAIVSDYDGDGKQELALMADKSIWLVKNGEVGSASNLIESSTPAPEHLIKAPFTYQGRTVLMSVTQERIAFYLLDARSGLVEVGSTPTPPVYA